jgi:hypothetical protein
MKKLALEVIEERLKTIAKQKRGRPPKYYLPSLWLDENGLPRALKIDDPYRFYRDEIRKARKLKAPKRPRSTGGGWSRDAIIYNIFVRTTTAFDHDQDGKLDLPLNRDGFRETGTFLKCIALLPYIKKLGANTVHLLPITAIGHDGNKGTLGSPYAIRNPYEIDEKLSEPLLGLDAKTEFKAFVEAAHKHGLRVVVEFVFRTAAKDADWVKEHPEWFYWIREEIPARDPGQTDESRYGSPLFTREELDAIHQDVQEHRFDALTPPHQIYQEFFTQPPERAMVEKVDGRYTGVTSEGRRVKIPGAFADWPPDDNQPPWGDVTYLRMYTNPDFNYIGYNTIRMYDTRLSRREYINSSLWERIVGIIPYYQREFHIDGVMIDMGHALPMDLKKEMIGAARRIDPDFGFWDENFSIARKSVEEGYNAVFGFLWIDQHHPSRMRSFCKRCSNEGFPISFFATSENHNTPRAASRPGGTVYSMWSWVVNCFLPGIPFIHSGFELGERYPTNTGLDFTAEQLKHLPSEKLPLFSEYAYDWCNKNEFARFVAKVSAIREKYHRLITDQRPQSFVMLNDPNDHILAFARVMTSPRFRIAVVTNMNFRAEEQVAVRFETKATKVTDLLTGKKLEVSHTTLSLVAKPGQCFVFEY